MVDVVIVGGGPVGCFLAVLLDDMGVSNVVIERDEHPYTLPRAIVMDDEIQRAAHDHGLGAWLQANTSRLERGDFLAPDGTVAIGADIPPMGLQGVPPVVVHYQPELDTMLRAECVARGTDARWGRTVTGLVDHGSHCVTTLDTGETLESRWVVGCDGASSWTRRHIGLTLEDLRFAAPDGVTGALLRTPHVLLFLDADVMLRPTAVAEMAELMQEGGLALSSALPISTSASSLLA